MCVCAARIFSFISNQQTNETDENKFVRICEKLLIVADGSGEYHLKYIEILKF